MKNEQKKVRIWFTVIAISLACALSFSVWRAHDSVYLRPVYVRKMFAYMPYRIEYLLSRTLPAHAAEIPARAFAQEVPVLLYHGIVEEPDGANVLQRDFADQLFALKQAGYATVTLADFEAFLDGTKTLPDRSVVLTFDDGRKDSFYPVDPVLHALNYTAVQFVITNYSLGKDNEESPFYLSVAELKALQKTGRWEIASHSKAAHDFYAINEHGEEGHFLSNALWIPSENRYETSSEYMLRIYEDLRGARDNLKTALGVETNSFAFPFGDFGRAGTNLSGSEQLLLHVVGKIYKRAYYQTWGSDGETHNRAGEGLLVRRINVSPLWSGDDLVRALEAGRTKDLLYSGEQANDHDWQRLWGDISVAAENLHLQAPSDGDSAAAFLNGSTMWSNYEIDAHATVLAGTSFSVIARFKNGRNYVVCNFTEDATTVDEHIQGVIRSIAAHIPGNLSKGEHEFSMQVYNNRIACILDGEKIMSVMLVSPDLLSGGIGFKTGSRVNGESHAVVRSVYVRGI